MTELAYFIFVVSVLLAVGFGQRIYRREIQRRKVARMVGYVMAHGATVIE